MTNITDCGPTGRPARNERAEQSRGLATSAARSNSDDWESGKAPMPHSLLVEPNGRRRYLLQMDCDLQIAPMLTQKLLGLPQCPILGRMRHAHGLTINGPDDRAPLVHPRRPLTWMRVMGPSTAPVENWSLAAGIKVVPGAVGHNLPRTTQLPSWSSQKPRPKL